MTPLRQPASSERRAFSRLHDEYGHAIYSELVQSRNKNSRSALLCDAKGWKPLTCVKNLFHGAYTSSVASVSRYCWVAPYRPSAAAPAAAGPGGCRTSAIKACLLPAGLHVFGIFLKYVPVCVNWSLVTGHIKAAK